MKKLLMGIGLGVGLFAVDGYEVYKTKCASCHIEDISKKETLKRLGELKAPPMIEVAKRLDRNIMIVDEDDAVKRAVVIAFIKDYIVNTDLQKSMCDPIAIEKFGIMPSLKGKISEEEREAVANWVIDFYAKKEFK